MSEFELLLQFCEKSEASPVVYLYALFHTSCPEELAFEKLNCWLGEKADATMEYVTYWYDRFLHGHSLLVNTGDSYQETIPGIVFTVTLNPYTDIDDLAEACGYTVHDVLYILWYHDFFYYKGSFKPIPPSLDSEKSSALPQIQHLSL